MLQIQNIDRFLQSLEWQNNFPRKKKNPNITMAEERRQTNTMTEEFPTLKNNNQTLQWQKKRRQTNTMTEECLQR